MYNLGDFVTSEMNINYSIIHIGIQYILFYHCLCFSCLEWILDKNRNALPIISFFATIEIILF